jgi:hypothetical protein
MLLVQPSSEPMVEPVRQASSFAEKQESRPARLLVVLGERMRVEDGHAASLRVQERPRYRPGRSALSSGLDR